MGVLEVRRDAGIVDIRKIKRVRDTGGYVYAGICVRVGNPADTFVGAKIVSEGGTEGERVVTSVCGLHLCHDGVFHGDHDRSV